MSVAVTTLALLSAHNTCKTTVALFGAGEPAALVSTIATLPACAPPSCPGAPCLAGGSCQRTCTGCAMNHDFTALYQTWRAAEAQCKSITRAVFSTAAASSTLDEEKRRELEAARTAAHEALMAMLSQASSESEAASWRLAVSDGGDLLCRRVAGNRTAD